MRRQAFAARQHRGDLPQHRGAMRPNTGSGCCVSGNRTRRAAKKSARCRKSATRGSARRSNRPPPPRYSGRGRSRRHDGSAWPFPAAFSTESSRCSGAMRSRAQRPHRGRRTVISAPRDSSEARMISRRSMSGRSFSMAASTFSGERLVEADENGLRVLVVLRLRKQVHRDPLGIGPAVAQHHDLGRPGDHVDVHLRRTRALGGGDIHISRTDDLVDLGNRLRAVSERRDRLRAADA